MKGKFSMQNRENKKQLQRKMQGKTQRKTQEKIQSKNRFKFLKLLGIIGIVVLAISVTTAKYNISKINTLEEKEYAAGKKQTTFEAYLYDSSDSSGTATELTTNSTDSKKLTRGNQLLTIKWNYDANDSHTLDITVPAGMYIVADSWMTSDDYFQSVTFTKLSGLSGSGGQGTGSYSNDQTGTLHYETKIIEDLTPSLSMQMFVAFDEAVWIKNPTDKTISLTGDAIPLSIVADSGTSVSLTKAIAKVITDETIWTGSYLNPTTGETIITPSTDYKNIATTLITRPGTTYQLNVFEKVTVKYTFTIKDSNGNIKDIEIPYKIYDLGFKHELVADTNGIYTLNDVQLQSYGNGDIVISWLKMKANADCGLERNDKITIRVDYVTYNYFNYSRSYTATKTFRYEDEANLEIRYINKSVPTEKWLTGAAKIDNEALGLLSVINTGAAAAENAEATYVFDTSYIAGNTLNIKVETLCVPLPKGQTTTVYATLINEKGETKEVSTSVTNKNGNVGYSGDLQAEDIAEEEGWYFWKVNFIIPSISSGYTLYANGARESPNQGGAYFGRMPEGAATKVKSILTLTVDGKSSTGTATTTVVADEKTTIKGIIELNTTKSVLKCKNGEQLKIYAKLSKPNSYSSNTQFIPNPVVYFILPKNTSVGSTTIGYEDYDEKEVEAIKVRELESGDVIYKAYVGKAIGGRKTLAKAYFHLNIEVDEKAEYASYKAYPRLLLTNETSEGKLSNVSITRSGQTADIFDIDEDSNTTEMFAAMPTGSTTYYLTIDAPSYPTVKAIGNVIQYDGEEHQLGYVETNGGTVTYSLTEDGEYTTTPPSATKIGDYKVYYKIEATEDTYELLGSYTASINLTTSMTLENEGADSAGTTNIYYLPTRTRTIDGVKVYYYSDYDCLNPLTDGYKIELPTRDGYDFKGYYTYKEGVGDQVIDAEGNVSLEKYNDTEECTLYAYWVAHTYTVVYNSNTGTGTMANQSFTYGEKQNLKTNSFVKEGFEFTGWNTKANGKGTSYTDKEEVSNLTNVDKGKVTLYAQWKDITAPVVSISKTDYNTFSWQASDNVKVTGYAITTTDTTPTTYTTTGTLTSGSYDIDATTAQTYYVWAKDAQGNVSKAEIKSYKVTKSQGTGTTLKVSVSDGTTSSSSSTGSTGSSGSSSSDSGASGGSGTAGSSSGTSSSSGDTELTATSTCVLSGTIIKIEASATTGYNTVSVTKNGAYIEPSSSYTIYEDATIKSEATLNKYYVEFNSNGGSGTMSNQTFTYGTAQNLKANEFTRAGYTFLGWSTDKSATKATYTDKKSVKNLTTENNATVTLYAIWSGNDGIVYTVEHYKQSLDGDSVK